MSAVILTGDRPSGQLHLGHYVGVLRSRVELQDDYEQYVMIADLQALTDNFAHPERVSENVYELMRDYLAVGIDPDKTVIFLQSQVREIAELTFYYQNLVTLGRLQRNPTIKTEIRQKGYTDSLPVGFLCYPISQAADITIFKAELVPVGEDQLPILEQTNEIVRKFNQIYKTDCLCECKPFLSKAPRLVGIDGREKASKSQNNAIFLADSQEEVSSKVDKMYTDPNHIRVSDPGQVEGNAVFAYLDAFHPKQDEVEGWKEHYQQGGLGDVFLKRQLKEALEELLAPIRERREQWTKDQLQEILVAGTKKARLAAQKTMEEVRRHMYINYF